MVSISLLGISYGYWTDHQTLKGNATLLVQVSIVDKVKKENGNKVKKETYKNKKVDMESEKDKEPADNKAILGNELKDTEETKPVEAEAATNIDMSIEKEQETDAIKESVSEEITETEKSNITDPDLPESADPTDPTDPEVEGSKEESKKEDINTEAGGEKSLESETETITEAD